MHRTFKISHFNRNPRDLEFRVRVKDFPMLISQWVQVGMWICWADQQKAVGQIWPHLYFQWKSIRTHSETEFTSDIWGAGDSRSADGQSKRLLGGSDFLRNEIVTQCIQAAGHVCNVHWHLYEKSDVLLLFAVWNKAITDKILQEYGHVTGGEGH